MHRFFEAVIRPLLDAVQPSTVALVGIEEGDQPTPLVRWCAEHGVVLHRVDPERSLSALPGLGAADVVIIDGDHNWYTVTQELGVLEAQAHTNGTAWPLVLLHHVGWPYGRRDVYREPERIPARFRHPFRRAGVVPGEDGLRDDGVNPGLLHAAYEDGPRNGVRTAVEDFVAASGRDLEFVVVDELHGLGVLVDRVASEGVLRLLREEVLGSGGLERRLQTAEDERVAGLVEVSRLRSALAEQTRALRTATVELRTLERLAATEVAELEQQREAVGRLRARVETVKERRDRAEAELRSARSELTRLRSTPEVRLTNKVRRAVRPVLRGARKRTPQTPPRATTAPSPRAKKSAGKSAGKAVPPPDHSQERSSPRPTGGNGNFRGFIDELLNGRTAPEFTAAWRDSEDRVGAAPRLAAPGPLVSVVMPTFNRADIIGQAIDSLLAQSYANWELLVRDDASTDATEEVVRSYGDARISYAAVPKGGAARARNAGLAEARGEIVAYLDSDNIWHPEYLDVMVGALWSGPGRHSAYCKYIDVQVLPDRLRLMKWRALPFNYDALAERNYIDLNGFVHRRAVYEHLGGFNVELTRQQDWDLILKYAFVSDPVYVDSFLVLYRRNAKWNQITEVHRLDNRPTEIIRKSVADYYSGTLAAPRSGAPTVSILARGADTDRVRSLVEILDDPARVHRGEIGVDLADPSWLVEQVPGDVLHAIGAHVCTLGAALLHNAQSGRPVLLDVTGGPALADGLTGVSLGDVDPADPQLRDLDGTLWAAIMRDLARRLHHCTFALPADAPTWTPAAHLVRNSTGDALLDRSGHDQAEIRAALGVEPADVVALWAVPPQGEAELELADRVRTARPSHRLLVLDRSAPIDLARAVVAADAVVVPPVTREVAGAAVQPVVTAALALQTPLVLGDAALLGVENPRAFASVLPAWDLGSVIAGVVSASLDPEQAAVRTEGGRRLYQRQFARLGIAPSLELALGEAHRRPGVLDVAVEFADFFNAFRRLRSGDSARVD